MRSFLGEIHRRDSVLSATGWVHLALGFLFLVALFVDQRTILGLDPWVKPLKFALSITVYVWTVAWFLGDVRRAVPRAALRRVRGLGTRGQTAAIFGLAAGHFLVSAFVLGQALAGRPLLPL